MPGIPEPPHPLVARAFAGYLRWLARRHFSALHWRPPAALPAGPVLFVANHTTWWDGFLACLVTERLGREFQILMEAVHLERYWMFNRVGALRVRRGSTRAGVGRRGARQHAPCERPRARLSISPQRARPPPASALADADAAPRAAGARRRAPARPSRPVAVRYASWRTASRGVRSSSAAHALEEGPRRGGRGEGGLRPRPPQQLPAAASRPPAGDRLAARRAFRHKIWAGSTYYYGRLSVDETARSSA